MSMKNRFTAIKEIAEANPYGFTISIIDFQTPKKGYCVAMTLVFINKMLMLKIKF